MCMLACACTLFFQTLVLADVRRAITQQHTEGSVSISALFYLQSLSMANAVCVHAFFLAVNCASPLPVFAHLCRCLLSSAWIYCFRCQGFLSLDATLGLHGLFYATRLQKVQKTCKQTCAAKPSEPSVAHLCCACRSGMITSTSAFAQRREVSVGLKPEEHPL